MSVPRRAMPRAEPGRIGRPSTLSDAGWLELRDRLLQGDSAAELARIYRVSKSSISARFNGRVDAIKSAVDQWVAAEKTLHSLARSERFSAFFTLVANDSVAIELPMPATYFDRSEPGQSRLLALVEAEFPSGGGLFGASSTVVGAWRRRIAHREDSAEDRATFFRLAVATEGTITQQALWALMDTLDRIMQ